MLALLLVPMLSNIVIADSSNYAESFTLYFLNGIIIYDSLVNDTLILETPINISLKEGFEQRVMHLVQYNLFFNESIGVYTFNATRGYIGFFLSRIEVHGTSMEQAYSSVMRALLAPALTSIPGPIEIPEGVSNYTKSPHLKIIEVVKPEYERWFVRTYGYSIKDAGPLGIVATAAYFVQHVFIDYDPSSMPKTIDEVIDTRRGDCDDMSRVLVELLNAYGIPAVMCVGYVHVSNFNFTMPIENVTYKYVDCGPHAFVMAYIPNRGWLSLDLLAFTLLSRPFVFEGYSRETAVEEELVQEYLRLHRSLNAAQVLVLLREEEALKLLGKPITFEAVMRYFQSLLGIEKIAPPSVLNETDTGDIDSKKAGGVETPVPGMVYVAGAAIALIVLIVFLIVLTKRASHRLTQSLNSLKSLGESR